MLERTALRALRVWARQSHRKPLILRGARQVGKTTLVHQFGKEFDSYIYINLERPSAQKLFHDNPVFEDLVSALFAKSSTLKESGKTLIFIDEIQNVPEAIQVLRYFYEDTPELYVIATGSLLDSVMGTRHISFPVGRVQFMALRPFTFVEFLKAMGKDIMADALINMELPHGLNYEMMSLFKKYMIVGGLPEAVASYVANEDVLALNQVFDSLLTTYKEDVDKYTAKPRMQAIIRFILDNGWQEAGHRIHFAKFSNSAYKSIDISEAFRLIERTFLLELVYPLHSAKLPVLPQLGKSPKLLWHDIGIVNYVAGMRDDVLFTGEVDDLWNGTIAEQVVAQELLGSSNQYDVRRYFWVRDARNSQAEVDFVIRYGSKLIPVEVKTGHNSKLRSLHLFMEESPQDVAIRLWNLPPSQDVVQLPSGKRYTLFNLPIYYAGHLEAFLKKQGI